MDNIKKILKIISSVITVILFFIASLAFVSFIQVKVLHKDYADICGYSIFEVVTGSMSGTIEINDYVIVHNTKNIELKDIITFRDNNSLVTHRVVEIRGNEIVTKGDANNSSDTVINKDQVIGKVVKILPNAGIWKKVFMDFKVILLLFITMAIFTIYFSIDDKKSNKRKIKNEKEKESNKVSVDKKTTVKKTKTSKKENKEDKDK